MPQKKNFKVKVKGKSHLRKEKRKEFYQNLEKLQEDIDNLDPNASITQFADLPLTQETQEGLRSSYYYRMTDIQSRSIPLSLKGHDVLAAARTGSGKTLAFLIPVLERLTHANWTSSDGLGALIISPTRELAVQIFEVLRQIGRFHTFSAGLVIGGKNLSGEKDRLSRMNILVATPGRLLQHLDQTVNFETSNLQCLVLDEADRILDMGFKGTLDAILHHLPQERQTLLFSATQTRSVKDLARLSLNNPDYVASSATETAAIDVTSGSLTSLPSVSSKVEMPSRLSQHYAVVNLPDKINVLWSFIKTHLFTKSIVFVSSGKQVRFLYENLRHLRPGVPLMHIHGRQKQTMRYDIYQKFLAAKHAFLFATDVAARGLDFPAVNWVIQMDCPEDIDMYVHRVGRTARYNREGKALLFLCPSEEPGMVKHFQEKGIVVPKIDINTSKIQTIQPQLQFAAFEYPEIKFLAQKAFISYVRSIYLQKDKSVFDLSKYPLEQFAHSLGLIGAPRVKWMSKQEAGERKNVSRDAEKLKHEDEEDDNDKDADHAKSDRRSKSTKVSSRSIGLADSDDDDDDDDDDDSDQSSHSSPQLGPSKQRSRARKQFASDTDSDSDVPDLRDDDSDDAESSGWDTATSDEEDNVTQKHSFSSHKKMASEAESGSESESEYTSDADSQHSQPHIEIKSKPTTKHERLFGRKNQTILSDHYNNLVDHGDRDDSDDDGNFMKIVRRDHDIDEENLPESTFRSKRKQKQAQSLKHVVAKGPRPSKVVFDEDGSSRLVSDVLDENTFSKEDAEKLRQEFVERERKALEMRDSLDKRVARDKRREKKLKKKQRDAYNDNNNTGEAYAELESASDDGYVTPDFDIPSESEDGDDDYTRPATKRARKNITDDADDLEALALKALQR